MQHFTTKSLQSAAPIVSPPTQKQVSTLADFLSRHNKITFLTGAGISTTSGIPDYRSPGRPAYNPIQHSEFISRESVRKRYWARSFFGFPSFMSAQPNPTHFSISALERLHSSSVSPQSSFRPTSLSSVLPKHRHLISEYRSLDPHDVFYNAECRQFVMQQQSSSQSPSNHQPVPQTTSADLTSGKVHCVITQNVDTLHSRAQTSSHLLVELHGALRQVRCLKCHHQLHRMEMQERLAALNADWIQNFGPTFYANRPDPMSKRPDGDVELTHHTEKFCVPSCPRCSEGVLKPSVVFFGGSVPEPIVDFARHRVLGSDALLIMGSSLAVWSSFRFVRMAADEGIPIAIVNIGPTRGDNLAQLKIEASLPDLMSQVVKEMGGNLELPFQIKPSECE